MLSIIMQAERDLRAIIDFLNGEGSGEAARANAARANLALLIQAWQEARSAPMARPYSVRGRSGIAPLPTLLTMSFPPGCPSLREIENRCVVHLAPAGPGAYHLIAYQGENGKPWTAWDFACQQFVRLITNPACDRLGGPCPRCGKHFVRKTAKPSIYCSARCASQATAIKATIKARQEQHANKLAAAREGIEAWERLARRGRVKQPWKEWVSKYKPGAEITPKFLSRALNKGELQGPPERKEKISGRPE